MSVRTRARAAAQDAVRPVAHAGLTLYVGTRVASDWTRLVLAEKDVDSAVVRRISPGRIDEDFLVLNPSGSLPTLADREGVIVGARVVAEYLDERYPHPPLMPLEPAGRARVRMNLQRIEEDLFPLADALDGDAAEAESARRRLLADLRAGARYFPVRGHALGADYTLVDTAWSVLLQRVRAAGLVLPAEAASVTAYAARLFARPACARSQAPDGVARTASPASRRRS